MVFTDSFFKILSYLSRLMLFQLNCESCYIYPENKLCGFLTWSLPAESSLSSRGQYCYLEHTPKWHSGNRALLECHNPEIFLSRKQEEGQMEGKHPPLLTLLCSTEKPEKKKTWGCIKTPKIKLYGSVYFLKV